MSCSSSEPCFSHSLFDLTKLHQNLSEHISKCFHFLYQSKTLSGTYLCLALISKEGCTFAVQRQTVKCSSQVPCDEAMWISSCSDTCAPYPCVHRQCQGKPTSPLSLKSSFGRWMESLHFLAHFHIPASAQTSQNVYWKVVFTFLSFSNCSPSCFRMTRAINEGFTWSLWHQGKVIST